MPKPGTASRSDEEGPGAVIASGKESFFTRRSLTRSAMSSALVLLFVAVSGLPSAAQQPGQSHKAIYDQIRSFSLDGGSAIAENLVLKRDRVEMTFDGTFYFTSPIGDRVTGAVFRGRGKLTAAVPDSPFEQDNIRRILNADKVESDFQSAVLVFTDDTFKIIGSDAKPGQAAPADAVKLAGEAIPRMLMETGANLASRATISIANQESPGFFFAQVDGGALGRFVYVLDPQNRIPVANFGINGGEKGLIFRYNRDIYSNDILMAFYSLDDYRQGIVSYSDANDIVDIEKYEMTADVRTPEKIIRLRSKLAGTALLPRVSGVSFTIGENLTAYDNIRLKKQLRIRSVRMGATVLEAFQEDWETGFSIFLPSAMAAGQKFEVEIDIEGDFMRDSEAFRGCHYPSSNASWYPRHGYLDRSTYQMTFQHRKRSRIASSGVRISEKADPESKDDAITVYRLDQPVSLVTFAVGPFERHAQKIKWEKGGETQLELNSLPGGQFAIKEDFILAELDNSIRYFAALFGDYPYSQYGAAVHPYGFGQGFATMLTIPPTDRASKYVYAFVSHETAHQWWGNVVAWRSYRDQWLSEGFAEYSALLYTAKRDNAKAQRDLMSQMRERLKGVPVTTVGVGKGRLYDVGPIILGHRLNTSKTFGAYQALIYNKGALVLRMLHFLFTNPANGDGQPFFDMMSDFVNRFRNKSASSDDFRAVANEHFVRTPLARKYQLKDLDWFFSQWVHQTTFPSYRLEYQLNDQADGSVMLTGTLFQDNTPDKWFMPLPLFMDFGSNQSATGTVHGLGKQTPVSIKLPRRPVKVQLDAFDWILSEKTETRAR